MTRKPKNCIFCGHPDISKEHIWSKWTYKYVPTVPGAYNVQTTILSARHDPKVTAVNTTKQRQGSVNTIKIKAVCRIHCNNGWMSVLETSVKPILIPLLSGEPAVLGQQSQRTLATWAAMKAMICESNDLDDVATTQEERLRLMQSLTPPDTWKIWIGQVGGRQWRSAFTRHAVTLGEVIDGKPQAPNGNFAKNTQSMTLGIGGLLIHIVASTLPIFGFNMPNQIGRHLRVIWPYEGGIFWPTGSILSERDADFIAEFLRNTTNNLIWASSED